MMIVTEILGNLADYPTKGKIIDYLSIEWYEAPKKIQRKKTDAGTEIAVKFLKEGQTLKDGDILKDCDNKIIAVNILATEVIQIIPKSLFEMGFACYEIGNKHIPLFIQEDNILLPYEKQIFYWLEVGGFRPEKKTTKLLNALRSNVQPHGHGGIGTCLFQKILKMSS